MGRCALALVGSAVAVAGVDLAHKAAADGTHFHARSAGYVGIVLVLLLAWSAAIVVVRSPAMAVGGGILAGGAAGNVISLAIWPGVPNPLAASAIAFNLADIFVVGGFVLVARAAIELARGDRGRLSEPVRLTR
jgi:hypothetical protein